MDFNTDILVWTREPEQYRIDKDKIGELKLWEGDKIFFRLLQEEAPFFSLKLRYEGDMLAEAILDGKELKLD